MKKCKLALVGLLLVLSMGVLVACGNEKNEETGSNTDSGNNHESTGVIEEIVTDAATGVKDAVTEAGTILEDAGRGVVRNTGFCGQNAAAGYSWNFIHMHYPKKFSLVQPSDSLRLRIHTHFV